jgi:4-diphosphocytidyl-2-C-methyl-D-erythritol kinase
MTLAGARPGGAGRGEGALEVRVAAPAKINLHLEVLGRRSDGFHDLVSLFIAVDLADTLRLERTRVDGPVTVRGLPVVPDAENLVVRAIELFRRRAGLAEGVNAVIEKRIPIGAGLGGGSSDAAAALRGLQALFGSPLSADVITDCARALGSDVPFFLAGPAALAEGRGERLRSLAARLDFAVVAVTPAARVSTAEAFTWLDEDRAGGMAAGGVPDAPTAGPSPDAVARAYRDAAPGSWRFSNSFDGPVDRRLAAIGVIRERIRSAGAPSPRLTGSGSTMIAVFDRLADAAACSRRLAADPPPGCAAGDVRVLAPLASLPGVRYYG